MQWQQQHFLTTDTDDKTLPVNSDNRGKISKYKRDKKDFKIVTTTTKTTITITTTKTIITKTKTITASSYYCNQIWKISTFFDKKFLTFLKVEPYFKQ